MAERLLILDSNSILHRVFHALPPLTTEKGEPINAVYGFLLVLFRVIKEFQPTYICACFDFPAKTFRHHQFKEYKAQRPPCPKELVSQIPKIKGILKVFKIPIFEKEGYEADDLIGTIVSKTQGLEKIIVSGDLDNLQLVSKETKVFVLSGAKKSLLYDEKEVKKKYQGLKPEQIPDLKALIGDPSDNIPGVPGFGEKTAIKLLMKFENLTNLYREIEGKQKIIELDPKLKENLLKHKNQVLLSKSLTQIKKDAPIEVNMNECQWGKYKEEEVVKIFEQYGFNSLKKRLAEIKLKEKTSLKKVEQQTLF